MLMMSTRGLQRRDTEGAEDAWDLKECSPVVAGAPSAGAPAGESERRYTTRRRWQRRGGRCPPAGRKARGRRCPAGRAGVTSHLALGLACRAPHDRLIAAQSLVRAAEVGRLLRKTKIPLCRLTGRRVGHPLVQIPVLLDVRHALPHRSPRNVIGANAQAVSPSLANYPALPGAKRHRWAGWVQGEALRAMGACHLGARLAERSTPANLGAPPPAGNRP